MPNFKPFRRGSGSTRGVAASALVCLMAVGAATAAPPAAAAAELPPTGQTYEHYTPLKEAYRDYFSFGIFGAGEIDGLIYNYESYTPGNEMKPESTQAVKGEFTFEAADAAMARYAERNPDLKFYGHTLAWHSQTPTWMWDAPPARYDQPGTFDAEVALDNMNAHIEGVLGRYGGDLVAIDVVNEAVGTADPADWRASLAKGEGWYQALGSDWVELAFLKAAAVVDAAGWDVKLIYNDFGLDSPAKARVVYEMVKDINERYEGVRPNGKPLIEVIGMQGHYNLDTDVAAVESNIELFALLGDVEVNVTEMDIALPPGTLTPENENNQGMKYAELFQVYRDYAAGPANTTGNPQVITAVKLAGVRDVRTGWKGGEFAMPYDYDGNAKDALLGILYPAEFLATHDYIEIPGGGERPSIPGVHVYDTGLGDSWSGANIILGDDASVWPWSTTDDGEVAFSPEPGATYRLTVNYTAKGTTSIRVRWIGDNTNGGYTSGDGAAVNDHQYGADEVAEFVPAYFNSGMVNMGSYDLVTEITLDGSQPADALVGNLAVRGGAGGNAFSINSIKVEQVSGDGDRLLVDWPNGAPDAPNTTLHYQGNNWVTVALDAEAAAPATLARTEYRIDGGDWVTYTEPFTLKRSDRQTLTYRSVDSFGTAEPDRCVTFAPGNGRVDVEVEPDTESLCV
ncbi:endo-1,4-beta-xylanase [Glycomyces paridis]|uniref:Beta-xylanase n=1 Tax=Glycomyces paridis TaxID=2126555 RepID=A0A4S8P6H5_9ACTN|nr:endo-1,4-beta-xylanase [Glycomyces paridis]THV24422.1 endo-1,4-beta-xylanase [Glycomyces paridis]